MVYIISARVLHEDEKPLDILLSQENGVKFILRYANTGKFFVYSV